MNCKSGRGKCRARYACINKTKELHSKCHAALFIFNYRLNTPNDCSSRNTSITGATTLIIAT